MENIKERKVFPMPKWLNPEQTMESALENNGASLGGFTSSNSPLQIHSVPTNQISTSRFQTREIPEEDELEGLKQSILNHGIIQPIIVRKVEDSTEHKLYELVAGERRFRAAKLAGLNSIPAIIQNWTDQESLEISIIENAQRENLNPIEEALAFKMLGEKFALSQGDIAKAIGKNRATISNSLRLLNLPEAVIEMLKTSQLSAGHGRALLMLDDEKLIERFARKTVLNSLSVRMLEELISRFKNREEEDPEPSEEQVKEMQVTQRLQNKVSQLLGLEKVRLQNEENGSRRLMLTFDTEASWKRFMAKIRD